MKSYSKTSQLAPQLAPPLASQQDLPAQIGQTGFAVRTAALTARKTALLLGACASLVVFSPMAVASSTILDGTIEKVETKEDGTVPENAVITLRGTNSPYCSESPLSHHLTHHTGHYRPFVRNLQQYKSLYIDEVPVTPEQMAKVIKPGLRGTMFMNRKYPYFLRVELRNPGSRMGFVGAVNEDQTAVQMSSPQHNHGPNRERVIPADQHEGCFREEDGTTRLDDTHYPPFQHQLPITEQTEVIGLDLQIAGTGIAAVEAIAGEAALYQPARSIQRVEILPPNYADWSLATDAIFLGNHKQQEFSVTGVMLSTEFDKTPIPQIKADGTPWLRKDGSPMPIKGTTSYHMYRFAGKDGHGDSFGSNEPGPYQVPIYFKGAWNILDGYYSNRFNFQHLMLRPGNFVVSTGRRTRTALDSIMYSTEHPAAWGTVTAIDGDTVTVTAPDIPEVPLSGEQTITLAADAEYIQVGIPVQREQALSVGAIIKVFAPHPARFYLGKAHPTPEVSRWKEASSGE